MLSLRLDIDARRLQNDLIERIPKSGVRSIYALIVQLVIEQMEDYLRGLTDSEAVRRFKIEWLRPGYGNLGLLSPVEILSFQAEWLSPSRGYSELLSSLYGLAQRPLLDLGYLSTTIIADTSSVIRLEEPTTLFWREPVEVKRQLLKTVQKQIVRTRVVELPTDLLRPVCSALTPSCKCPPDFLIPHISGVWDWALKFVCKVCGKIYFCECFRTVLDSQFANLLQQQTCYGELGRPSEFIVQYRQSEFRESICHLCRDVPSELHYCDPMYGSKVLVHYGPYIKRTALEKGIDLRDAENEIRDVLGIPRIGEGWLSEVELLHLVRRIFPNEDVIHQASPDWLGLQRLDIYMPQRKLAVEYQGRQHYDAVPFFGGEDGLLRTQERDKRKVQLCAENGIALVYFRFDEPITAGIIEERVRKALHQKS